MRPPILRLVLPLLLAFGCTSNLANSTSTALTAAAGTTLTNGGFESGNLTGWTSTGFCSAITSPHTGSYAASVGDTLPSTDSSLSQSFTAPSGSATLSFYYQVHCPDSVSYDWASATLKDTTANTTATLLSNTCTNSGTWVKVTSGALTAGHGYTLTLSNHDDNYSGDPTYTLYDDVTLSGGAPPPVNDFSIALNPSSGTVAAGSSITYSVATAIVSGSAQSIALSISGLPAGLSGSFNPATVTAGQGSSLTLSASGVASAGTSAFTATGTATSGSHSASGSVTVTVPPPPPPGGLINGNFETGNLNGWTASGVTSVSTTSHSGSYAAELGSASPSTDSSISQTFTTPAAGGTLSFFFRVVCPDTVQYDWATATLTNNATSATTTLLSDTCSSTGTWAQVTSGALAGSTSYTLKLANHDDNYSGDPTYTLYDDVTLGGSTPPPANDFSVSLTPASANVATGSSTSFTVSTAVTSGSAQAVSLSVSGLPSGVTGSFSAAQVTAGQGSTLTLTASSSASGSSTFTVTGSATSGTHGASGSVTVTAPAANDFSIALTPASQSVSQGAAVSYSVATSVTSGSAQTVSLSAGGFPAGVTGSFSQPSISAGQSATLTVSASASASGSANFTVTGSAASGSHAAQATISVNAAGGTGIGPTGGSVDHLYFAVVGDTRPGTLDGTSSYPTAIITKIYQEMQALNPRPQFVIGTGDYMFASTTGSEAQTQMNLYTQAQSNYSGTVFASMGNHECDGFTADNCTPGQTTNYNVFMNALVTPLGYSTPYYSIPVHATDNSWTAKLVIVACNQWDAAQRTWLTNQLASSTTYTILARHEPAASSTGPCVTDAENLMTQYPYNLSLVGHTHTFRLSSKEVIVGTGGAPITTSGVPYGFATVEKISSGWQVKQYDYSTGLPINTYVVP